MMDKAIMPTCLLASVVLDLPVQLSRELIFGQYFSVIVLLLRSEVKS